MKMALVLLIVLVTSNSLLLISAEETSNQEETFRLRLCTGSSLVEGINVRMEWTLNSTSQISHLFFMFCSDTRETLYYLQKIGKLDVLHTDNTSDLVHHQNYNICIDKQQKLECNENIQNLMCIVSHTPVTLLDRNIIVSRVSVISKLASEIMFELCNI